MSTGDLKNSNMVLEVWNAACVRRDVHQSGCVKAQERPEVAVGVHTRLTLRLCTAGSED